MVTYKHSQSHWHTQVMDVPPHKEITIHSQYHTTSTYSMTIVIVQRIPS